MKRKISILLITTIIIFNIVANAYPYNDVQPGTRLDTTTKELAMLNIMDGYTDGTFRPDVLVTKAEFVVLICKLLNIVELAKNQQFDTGYYDVDANHWACGYINAAKSYDLLSALNQQDQYGHLVFLPEQPITFVDGVYLIVGALGYKPKAVILGDYPGGYMLTANQEGLFKNTISGSEISRGTVSSLMYNALNIKLMEKTGEDQYGSCWSKVDKTLKMNFLNASIVTDIHIVIPTIVNTTNSDTEFKTRISNATLDNINVSMYVAVYDNNRKLCNIKKTDTEVLSSEKYKDINTTIHLDNNNYTFKIFLWDNNHLKPFSKVIE